MKTGQEKRQPKCFKPPIGIRPIKNASKTCVNDGSLRICPKQEYAMSKHGPDNHRTR
jgi:hypothetical protein